MDSKYQQYYNALNGKEFNSCVSKYSSTLNNVRSSITSMETIMDSSWSEKGLEYIKSTILPALKTQGTNIEQGVSILSTAVSKVSTLTSKLADLKSACDSYASCADDLKDIYKSRIDNLESSIDTLINEINGISLEIKNESTTFTSYITELNDLSSLARQRAEFIGDVNDTSKYYIDPAWTRRAKELYMFDNTTGEILGDTDTIYLKPGETRILTVRLPYNAGEIDKVIRTSAGGDEIFLSGKVVTARSDIDPDPNNIDYVSYQHPHWPDGVDLHTNYYDWIITANAEGDCIISQTCEYYNTNGNMPKAMVQLNVKVREDA